MAVIIYPPTINWSYMRQRPQNLMTEFARNGHQVFYCNLKQSSPLVYNKIAENLYVVNNVDVFTEQIIPDIKSSGSTVVVWCSWAMLANTLKKFRPDLVVYDCLDEFEDWLPYEPEMVEVADIVFCSSDHLMKRLSSWYSDKKIFLLNNACEFHRFNRQIIDELPSRPVDLPETGRIRIGYIGAWAWWIDEELVKKVCEQFPDHQVVVIGPDLGARFPKDVGNFIYLGLKQYEELSRYLPYLDICIIPFRLNETTIATNPIKAYEYLAAGKTVISTALPEMIKMQPLVKVGFSHDDFIRHIRESLESGHENIEEKMDFARRNSWELRYKKIEDILSHENIRFESDSSFFETIDFNEKKVNAYQPVADATISNLDPNANYDFDPACIGRENNAIFRYLVRFNVEDIQREIKKATLSLFLNRQDVERKLKAIEIMPLVQKWIEAQVTWNTRPPAGNPARQKVFNNSVGWLGFDVTQIVREWIREPDLNFGIMLKGHKDYLPFMVRAFNRHRHDFYSPKLKVYF